jgi:prepilin-type N-terminal cleavage/methylation domain-containing protein
VPVRDRQLGFTLVELIVVLAIVALLSAAALVGYRYARIRSLEASAITSLTMINQGQFLFMQTCGRHRYAPTLVSLATPPPGSDRAYVSPDLAASDPLEKGGYLIVLTGTQSPEGEQTCTGQVPLDRYRLTADPVDGGGAGARFFATNTDRVIYGDSASFAEDMPETGAPGHGQEIR